MQKNKEQKKLADKRENYLKEKAEWQVKIDARNLEIAEWDRLSAEGGHMLLPPRPKYLRFVYLDESYVNKNHSLGYTWFDPTDEYGAAVFMKSGKGERLVMLTAITEEDGILDSILIKECTGTARQNGTLLLFQAAKRSGDYHKNMNGNCFNNDWLSEMMIPALANHNIEAIFVMDNASYHLVPFPGSVDVMKWKNKKEGAAFMDNPTGRNVYPTDANPTPDESNNVTIPFIKGARFPAGGDTLVQMQEKATQWLDQFAGQYGIIRNITYADKLCQEHGHHILLTPPYHPELQPIEKLWRNVKMYVARKFSGNRSLTELWEHVREAFSKYASACYCAKNVADARYFEELYNTPGVHALSVRMDLIIDGSDDEVANSDIEEQFTSDSGSEDDE